LASASLAANPLKYPAGMAVDTAGNLWVANNASSSILAFNDKYQQLTTKTIT
jgi:sugar lactone lactonase YvrE